MSNANIENSDCNNIEVNINNISYTRTPFWLESNKQPIFCWLHLPSDNKIHNTGIVICNPIGYEYSHTHRTIRHLADHLAVDGYATIRFDYHGTGDSPSDLFEPKRIPSFLQNIDSAIEVLKKKTGVSQICLIGLRLGASLAAAYCENSSVDQLILWSSYTKGRTYVREAKALEKLASHSTTNEKNFIDSGGFIVTPETSDDLVKINLLKQNYNVNKHILIIERDDLGSTNKLQESIKKNGIPNVEKYLMAGYIEMMAEPHKTKIPELTLVKISNWINKQNEGQPPPKKINYVNNLSPSIINKHIHPIEEICLQQESNLMGILSHPLKKNQNKIDQPLIILVNSGSVHRIGPNRLYVELSRALALAGYSVLRFDLSNLGDSVIGNPQDENHPYPKNATQDILKTVNYMRTNYGFKKIVLAGLCSGAYNVFHAGLKLPINSGICEVIMINPLTIYRKTDSSGNLIVSYQVEKDSEHYSRSVLSFNKWKKLLIGKVDLLYVTMFSIKKFIKTVLCELQIIAEKLGIHSGSQLSKDLKSYVNKGIRINFFIASKDPGKRILMSQAKTTIEKLSNSSTLNIYNVPKSDHTFSDCCCRKRFVAMFVKHMNSQTLK